MGKAALTVGLFFGLAGTAGGAYATTTASQDPTTVTQSEVVHYQPQDLATARGVHDLYLGIDRAAHDVCDDTGEYVLRLAFAGCEQRAIANAVADVNDPTLTALYNEHFPRARLS